MPAPLFESRFLLRDEASVEYFDACARIRGISTTALVQRLLDAIAADQMVLSILDDEGDYRRRKGERSPRTPKQRVAP